MYQFVRSVLIWLGVAVVTLVEYPIGLVIWLLVRPFDPTLRFGHWYATFWGRSVARLNNRWKFTVIGEERIPRGRPLVLVSNHEGVGDILMMFMLDYHFKWIAKEILFKIPMMGWFMSHAGYIPLLRGNRESIKIAMDRAREYLKSGVSVLLFPEGTRSLDGELRPFKPGAFRLAIEGGYDILPLAIVGTKEALPKHSWKFSSEYAEMKMLVGDVIITQGMSLSEVDALAVQTRDIVGMLKARLEGTAPAEVAGTTPPTSTTVNVPARPVRIRTVQPRS